jgi:hypothetical protein
MPDNVFLKRPSNPFREWHGRVEWVGPECVKVTVLDEGYTGETEFVMRTEIVSVTKSQVPEIMVLPHLSCSARLFSMTEK